MHIVLLFLIDKSYTCANSTRVFAVPGKQAKILSDDNIEDLLLYAAQTRYPWRNRVIVLLSVKAGLRAGEIAKLTWEMVIGPDGAIGTVIELRNHAAKKGSGRLIPIHPDCATALVAWRSSLTALARSFGPSAASACCRRASCCGSPSPTAPLASTAARRIPAAARSSRARRGWCQRQADRCATFSCWPGIGRSRRRNATSTATAMRNALFVSMI